MISADCWISGGCYGCYDRLQDFTVHIRNSSNIDHHIDICAYHPGYISDGGRAVLPCDEEKVSRYLSVINSQVHSHYFYFFLCEVVVIGAMAAGECNIRTLAISEFGLTFVCTLL